MKTTGDNAHALTRDIGNSGLSVEHTQKFLNDFKAGKYEPEYLEQQRQERKARKTNNEQGV